MTEKMMKKSFSYIGWYLIVMMIVSSTSQLMISTVIGGIGGKLLANTLVSFCVVFGSMYLIGVPVANNIIKKRIVLTKEKRKMSLKTWIKFIPITILFTYIGSIIGNVVTTIITIIVGKMPNDPVASLLSGSDIFASLLFVGIIGPIVEEYVFRKQIINHVRMYGEKRAVIFSAFVFALFHGNLAQMFYAFTLGLVFGYVYIKTDDIKYSAGLHILVNTVSGVLVGGMINGLDLEVLDDGPSAILNSPDAVRYIIFIVYILTMILLAIVGIVILLKNKKNISFAAPNIELKKPFKTMYLNVGMVIFILNMLVSVIGTFLEI